MIFKERQIQMVNDPPYFCRFLVLTLGVTIVGIFNVLIEEDDILNIMENGLEEAVKLLDVSPSGRLSTTWGRIRDNN